MADGRAGLAGCLGAMGGGRLGRILPATYPNRQRLALDNLGAGGLAHLAIHFCSWVGLA